MRPLRAGGSRLWRTVHGIGNWSLIVAVVSSLVVGTALTGSTLVTAQTLGQGLGQPGPSQSLGQDPSFFPATGYRISAPALLSYFQRHGGVRTFGFPVSNDFQLVGHRVQIFQRQVLELKQDGTVAPVTFLDPATVPITHFDGLSLPAFDPDLVAAAPLVTPDTLDQGLSFVSAYVPDEWNGLPVNFQTTYLETVKCSDAFGDQPCDPSQLAAMALELWGMPTSQPTADPLNNDFVYQRFERGIMHFSRATGLTQGLLVGDWFKRVLLGMNLAPDVGQEVTGSRFYGQFAPAQPLGLARPNDLPDTSLAQAFRGDTLQAAGQAMPGAPVPTVPTALVEAATSIALTATAQTTQIALQATEIAVTQTAVALTQTAGVPTSPAVATAAPVSDIPIDPSGCLGDEQMWFVPRRPNVGTHVEVSVTSRRHHDVRVLRLVGPIDSGVPTERLGPLGFVWTWSVVPTVEAFHQWTFYADGLRPCITSGFNTFAPLGATPTPTETPIPTETPGTLTATPTSTPVPAPAISSPGSAAGSCNSRINLTGRNFGETPNNSQIGTNAQLIGGPPNAPTPLLLTIIGGSSTFMTVQIPPSTQLSGPLAPGGGYSLIVVNNGGVSNEIPFTVTAPGC